MRIGLVFPGFSANERDWCIPAFLNLVRTLAARHDVRVLALRYPHFRLNYNVHGACVTSLDGRTRRGIGALGLRGEALNWVVRAHRERSFDVLHAFFADEAGLVAAIAGKILGIPSVVSLAGGELFAGRDIGYGGQLSFTSRLANRIALALAVRVTVGSRAVHDMARRRIDSAKLAYAPLGVDTQMFSPASRPANDDYVLLNVASLVSVKDQARLLRVFRTAYEHEPRLRLQIVGKGPLEHALHDRALELGVETRVDWLGTRDHQELPDLYRAADLFALTSRYESQGLVVLEAAACGLPTVGTRVGILPELAPDAARVEDDDDALSHAIADLVHNVQLRRALGRTAIDHVRADFSLEASCARWEAIYDF